MPALLVLVMVVNAWRPLYALLKSSGAERTTRSPSLASGSTGASVSTGGGVTTIVGGSDVLSMLSATGTAATPTEDLTGASAAAEMDMTVGRGSVETNPF
ncbi:hypothetical protein C8R47DRAFT_1112967 [Mycena vitilis]|nr:hypothetical protein C8R47DRAFT_1112967 [Mycena vitilis]